VPLADVPAEQLAAVDTMGQWKLHAATIRPWVDGHEYKRRGMVAGEPQAKSNPPCKQGRSKTGCAPSPAK